MEQCLKRADKNVRGIAQDCLMDIDRTLEFLERELDAWTRTADTAHLHALLDLSARLIGAPTAAGLPDLDRVAASLCDLLDGFLSSGAFAREPVQVHLHAMRLLRRPEGIGVDVADLLAGLTKIRAMYASN
jgi:hypothetical protein